MPGGFLNQVDNSKLTPEFNGQGSNATTDTGNTQGNATPDNTNVNPQDGQAQGNIGNVEEEGYQIGDEHFDNVEDIIKAYTDTRNAADQLQKNYKNLQSDYTKKSQRLSMMNKMGAPNVGNYPNNILPNYNQNMYPGNYQQGNMIPDFNAYMYNRGVMTNGQVPVTQPMVQQRQATVDPSVIQMATDQKIAELRLQDQDFDDVAPILWDIIEQDPYFSNVKFTDVEMTKNTINLAYQMAKDRVNQARTNININNARREAYVNKQQKVANNDKSNVAGVGAAQNRQPKKTDAEIIKNSIIGAKPQKF